MPKKPVDILHAAMTNQFVIMALAIVLFLLVLILMDQVPGDIGTWWI
jgi:hypothetical protein